MRAATAEPTGHLFLDESEARQIVLVRAVEAEDPAGVLIPEPARIAAEMQARDTPQPALYLPRRARALLADLQARQPRIAALQQRSAAWERLIFVLPPVALLAGFLSDRVGSAREVDLLSPALLGFVAWNFAVYLLLALDLFRRKSRWTHWLAELPALFVRRGGSLQTAVRLRFQALWWAAAGPLEGARVKTVLHTAAAAWAAGLILSLLWGGIFRQYQAGWESTWLGENAVRQIVNFISLPARLLLDAPPYALDEIRQLRLRDGGGDVAQARRWAMAYIVFLLAAVVLPRALLAAWARHRVRRLSSRLRFDLADPYLAGLIERIAARRIRVAVAPAGSPLIPVLATSLSQAGASGDLLQGGSTLASSQGDELAVRLDGAADADLLWMLVGAWDDPEALAGEVQRLDRPTLVLAGPGMDAAAVRERLANARGSATPCMSLAGALGCWPVEAEWRDAIVRALPAAKKPGAERLVAAWRSQHERSWALAVGSMAEALLRAASLVEAIPTFAAPEKRRAAMARLLEQVKVALESVRQQMLQAYGVAPGAWDGEAPASGMPPGRWGGVAAGGLGGAALSALAGAKVDLLTGGLTLGAGAAIGAVIGAAGAFGLGGWLNIGGTVRLSAEQLEALATALLLQYLAVIHAGRAVDLQGVPEAWRPAAERAVAAQAGLFREAWKGARNGAAADDLQRKLGQALRAAAAGALSALYPDARIAPLE